MIKEILNECNYKFKIGNKEGEICKKRCKRSKCGLHTSEAQERVKQNNKKISIRQKERKAKMKKMKEMKEYEIKVTKTKFESFDPFEGLTD
jgi:hypothetical protein